MDTLLLLLLPPGHDGTVTFEAKSIDCQRYVLITDAPGIVTVGVTLDFVMTTVLVRTPIAPKKFCNAKVTV
jgi:hypothetical protein